MYLYTVYSLNLVRGKTFTGFTLQCLFYYSRVATNIGREQTNLEGEMFVFKV